MPYRFIAYPFALGPRLAHRDVRPQREGVAESADVEQHVRDKIMAILFTAPGERVMRPRFGAGLSRTIFENLSPLARSAIEYRIRDSLGRDLGSDAILEDVSVAFDGAQGATLITIDYQLGVERSQSRLEIVV